DPAPRSPAILEERSPTEEGSMPGYRDEARSTLAAGGAEHEIFRLDALQDRFDVFRLPYTLRVLLENVLRGARDTDVEAVARWDATAEPSQEISFRPARVLL